MKKVVKYIIKNLAAIMVVMAAIMLIDSCNLNDEWDKYYENAPERTGENVLTIIVENENYSHFYNALIEYGFETLLSKNQYFTVFVPINSAFEGLPDYTDEEWTGILGFHIIYAKLLSHEFSDLDLMTTMGKYLKMKTGTNNEVTIFESAINMDEVDNYCRNGVIHEIDKLLVPMPNIYEYIMDLDSSFSILQDFILSMDERFIDYENSERLGVDDNGDAIYDTVWITENYFLDKIAGLKNESEAYTGFIPRNNNVREALSMVDEYFGNIEELDETAYSQLLYITFSGSFMKEAYFHANLPDSIVSVTGKKYEKSILSFNQTDLVLSNGMVHMLDGMTIPKSFFLLPIVIECDRKQNRKVSNTIYPIEVKSDTRATNGSFVFYGCAFVGDYIEYTVDMVLRTKYWFIWTGPRQGPSTYQLSIKDEITGEFVYLGDPVNNWTKGWFIPVEGGSYTFNEFGTKTVRINIVDELPVVGLNSIYIDYIKLVPDEVYNQ
ncbi:MAG: fasciclin domain-containing protein [Bacteroidales bacterium]|nr:fasciclin domain-containing protein [Bacteroidales bacterium]